MEVREFSGGTVDDALRKAFTVCGADAVILHQVARPAWQVWRPRWTVTVGVDATAPTFAQQIPEALRTPPITEPAPSAPVRTAPSPVATPVAMPEVVPASPPRPTRVQLDPADRRLLQTVLQALPTAPPPAWTWPTTWPVATIPPRGVQRIAVIGPTGAGKTTTVGKLAAGLALRDHRSTHLITADTFRAGATAQLEQFARVLQIPCTVVGSGQPIRLDSDPDPHACWLLDTPGVTARESYRLAEIQAWLQAFQPTQVYVVIPASWSVDRLPALAAVFGALVDRPPAVLITKADEVDTLAPVAAALADTGWAWSYLGTGQQVPDDLVRATVETVRTWPADDGSAAPSPSPKKSKKKATAAASPSKRSQAKSSSVVEAGPEPAVAAAGRPS